MLAVIHADTFRCRRCGCVRAVEVTRELAVTGDGVTDANRQDLARMAATDLRLVRCPACGKRERLGFHLAFVLGVSVPLLAVGATSWLLDRPILGTLGLLIGGLALVLGLRAPGSADRAVRFLEPRDPQPHSSMGQ
jgi:hypothetical protein